MVVVGWFAKFLQAKMPRIFARFCQVFTSGIAKFNLFYYRDKNGLECDAIIHLVDGKWGAIEVKLSDDLDTINSAAKGLIKLRDTIDTTKMLAPSFLAVISGIAKIAYRREDGVYVVPIGCLGP